MGLHPNGPMPKTKDFSPDKGEVNGIGLTHTPTNF